MVEFVMTFADEESAEFSMDFGEYLDRPVPSNYGLITWNGEYIRVS